MQANWEYSKIIKAEHIPQLINLTIKLYGAIGQLEKELLVLKEENFRMKDMIMGGMGDQDE